MRPGGAGAGSDGVSPGLPTVTSKPGRKTVFETPLSPVTVRPLPKTKIASSLPFAA